MIKICFVCHGNICRSPMAEFVMKALVKKASRADEFHIESRATHTDEIWNGIGSHIYPPAEQMLRKKHIPYDADKRAELLTREEYGNFDYFIGMDKENLRSMQRIFGGDKSNKIRLLLDFDGGGSVADPWYSRNFELAYSDILRGCKEMLSTLRKE